MKIDLNGIWTLKNDRKNINCPATVPGCVHTDLINNNIIDDPFWRVNEYTQRWICYEDWTYEREFQCDEKLLSYNKVLLECMGLDTLATVYINDEAVGETKSFYRPHFLDIKKYLKLGTNKIKIFFASATGYAEPLAHTGTGAGPVHHTMFGSERIRKSLYMWGWDWGPKIPTTGIWRDIFIKGYNECKVRDFKIKRCENKLDFEIKTDKYSDNNSKVEIDIYSPKGEKLTSLEGFINDKFSYEVKDVLYWNPNGFGKQYLYKIILKTSDEIIEKSYGFRDVEWVEDKDKWGKTFYVKVNGNPIFLKGANHIPLDQFPTRITNEHREKIIKYCIDANMNCLRIWGGGYYEDDNFYDLCDKYGILIWHDLMFGNSHYPMDDEELCYEYVKEPKENIRRLRHHPSIIIWSGNNEIEQCYNNGWPYAQNHNLKEEYKELFVNRIGKMVSEEDEERKYVRSSGHSEVVCSNPNLETDGDAHYWALWGKRYDYEEYRDHTARLLSEFGCQSLPSMETVKTFSEPYERDIYSQTMTERQKAPGMTQILLEYLNRYYNKPKDFENLVYISQVFQGCAIKCCVEHLKRNINDFHCMGALYWQLGDCWPAISWASLEYSGRWKGLHFMAKEFFKPVSLSLLEKENSGEVHISNDSNKEYSGKVKYSIRKTDGTVLYENEKEVNVKPCSDVLVDEISIENYNKNEIFICGEFEDQTEIAFFVKPRNIEFLKPDFNIKIKDNYLVISCDKPSFYTQINVPDTDVRLDKNFVSILPNKKYKFEVIENDGLSLNEIVNKIEINNLATYF